MKNVAEMIVEAQKPQSFQREVWQTLSRIDCSKHVERKNGLSYLSWAWAWAILMETYPESDFDFMEPHEYPDGTQEMWVTVTVRDGDRSTQRRMWLPVLDHANRPIKSPNAFQINTTRMRLLTKCLAMLGLGHHIYAGEDVPRAELDVAAVGEKVEKRSTSVVQAVIDNGGANFDPLERDEIVAAIDAAFTLDPVEGLQLVDAELLDEKLDYLRGDAELKIACWAALPSKVRTFIKKRERGE
jgi:hypothetical protein